MAEETKIEWCDSTFNPWIGCTKVSPGCEHCYAEVSTPSRSMKIVWGAGQPRHRTSIAAWKEPLRWNRKRFMECTKCGWRGECAAELIGCGACGSIDDLVDTRRRVFCASLADVFDNEVDPAWRADLFRLIRSTPNLDWLLLTKRIGNAARMMDEAMPEFVPPPNWPWPLDKRATLPNLWLGATIVNQEEMDRDGPKLAATPARVRFFSMEPLLEKVDARDALAVEPDRGGGWRHKTKFGESPTVDWIIVGGESGAKARPMDPDWVRMLRNQCEAVGVPLLFKQWGEWAPYDRGRTDGATLATPYSLDEPLQQFGKKLAGRMLDGRLHTGFPS